MKTPLARILQAIFVAGMPALSLSVSALERLEPPKGCYLGFNLNDGDTIARLGSRLGITPAVYVRFFDFPLSESSQAGLTNFLEEVRSSGGIALITLEPWQGLDSLTETNCVDLGTLCAAYEQQGIDGILIRFAHEMNGNWYPWGQQPILYKQKFRLLAQSVHSRTARTALLWAPNYGVGYPFGVPRPVSGSADFVALDTNGDGVLSPTDDMYEPYYPGDDVVDWVGMTVYHWGVNYPWFENELPLPNSFANSLTGTHQGVTPNFYARYCADGVHKKPMAVPETAAFYNTQQSGPEEFALKQAWWEQVFNVSGDTSSGLDVALHFPKLKCINWFDHYKQESEAQNNWIDWRVSADQRMRAEFVRYIRAVRNGQPYFLTAQQARWQQSSYAITAIELAHLLSLTGSISFSLNVKAQTACDLVVDLLDAHFDWQGGTRVPLNAGTQTISAAFPLVQALKDGTAYRWNIFLTPTGSNHQQALAWYKGPQPVARTITPAIEIVGFPPVLVPGSNFVTRVKYVAAQSAFIIVNLLDTHGTLQGGGTATISRGDVVVDVPIALRPGVNIGNFVLDAFLSNSSTNWQTPMARAERVAVRVAPIVEQDLIKARVEPAIVPVGEVFRFTVSYAAITNRDLHVDLFDASTNYLASAFQPVPPGSGVRDMTISYTGAKPGEYFVTAFITPSGESWKQAVAWSADRSITVIGSDYQQWVESYWGVTLANDLIAPQDDPDGDGASNGQEFLAHTDPRNAADVLKMRIARVGASLIVSWQSVAGRSYQLFESPNSGGRVWAPVGEPLAGTGTMLQVAVSAENAARFYRVQVLP